MRVVRRIHLWLGLVAGAVLVAVTLSGAAVSWRPELERLLAAPPSGAAGEADRDAVAAALSERYPGAGIVGWSGPAANGAVDAWRLRTAGPDGRMWSVFTDPATGGWLGDTRDSAMAASLEWMTRFHHDLLLGPAGKIVVGSCGFVLLGFLATGAWLWVAGPVRHGAGIRLRRRGPRQPWFDLHALAGVWGLPILAVIGLSGTLLAFPWMLHAAHAALGGTAADAPPTRRPPPGRADGGRPERPRSQSPLVTTGWSRAITAAAAAVPEGRPLTVAPPRSGPGAPWRVTMDYPGNLGARGGVDVTVDGDTGAVRGVRDPRRMTMGGWLVVQRWSFHLGTVGGTITRVLWFLAGVVPLVLLLSGLRLWRLRRQAPAQELL